MEWINLSRATGGFVLTACDTSDVATAAASCVAYSIPPKSSWSQNVKQYKFCCRK